MSKNKRRKKDGNITSDAWTEKEYEEHMERMYGMEFIVGFTEGGFPYGITIDEDVEKVDIEEIDDEELPF